MQDPQAVNGDRTTAQGQYDTVTRGSGRYGTDWNLTALSVARAVPYRAIPSLATPSWYRDGTRHYRRRFFGRR